MPLERATYQGIVLTGQLPLVLVCVVTDCDDVPVFDDVPTVARESSDSPDSCDAVDRLDVAPLLRVLELAAAVWVVVADCPSCHASTPPSESIDAMLSAVTALRARAARGLRRGRPAPARETGLGVGVRSSMAVTVRTGGERPARAG
jgi:hypothetical protein